MVEEEIPGHTIHSERIQFGVMASKTCMSLYCLVVIAPFIEISLLTEDLARLAREFGGLPDLTYRSSTTSYRLRFVDLCGEHDLLSGKVAVLKEKYPVVFFSLIESTQTI